MNRWPVSALMLLAACGGQSTHLDVGAAPLGVTVNSRIQYYDVSAGTLTELRVRMRELGPRWEGRAWTAATNSDFKWNYQTEPRGLACGLRRVRVSVHTIVTFPRWNPTTEPDSMAMAWWQQLNAGLVEHERGHALISVNAGGEIARALEGISGADCAAAGERANTLGRQLIHIAQQKQVEYDRVTRHGATQIQQAGRLLDP